MLVVPCRRPCRPRAHAETVFAAFVIPPLRPAMSASTAVRPTVARGGRTPIVSGANRRVTLAVRAPTAQAATRCRSLVALGARRAAATGVPLRGRRGCVRSSCSNARAARLTVRSALELPAPITDTCNFLTNLFPLWVSRCPPCACRGWLRSSESIGDRSRPLVSCQPPKPYTKGLGIPGAGGYARCSIGAKGASTTSLSPAELWWRS